VLLQAGRLKVARELALVDVLVKELLTFRVRITLSANETYAGDWREGQHDDLVLALCLACWMAENDGDTSDWKPTFTAEDFKTPATTRKPQTRMEQIEAEIGPLFRGDD
jgi:hypothetical protein